MAVSACAPHRPSHALPVSRRATGGAGAPAAATLLALQPRQSADTVQRLPLERRHGAGLPGGDAARRRGMAAWLSFHGGAACQLRLAARSAAAAQVGDACRGERPGQPERRHPHGLWRDACRALRLGGGRGELLRVPAWAAACGRGLRRRRVPAARRRRVSSGRHQPVESGVPAAALRHRGRRHRHRHRLRLRAPGPRSRRPRRAPRGLRADADRQTPWASRSHLQGHGQHPRGADSPSCAGANDAGGGTRQRLRLGR